MTKNTLEIIALVLMIIGGLNWGLVALGFNLVEYLFGATSIITTIVYALVGISALYAIFFAFKE
jgi:uncharacterized membrane protein YuzA (DUF378 family)